MKKIIFGAAILMTLAATAQEDTTKMMEQVVATSPFTISGYVEAYYSYDFNKPSNNARPGFIYNFNRHNEFNLNLGFIKGSYNTERVRANVAIAVGTYMNANYVAEPGTLKNIFEANAGYKLSAKKIFGLILVLCHRILVLKLLLVKTTGRLQEALLLKTPHTLNPVQN